MAGAEIIFPGMSRDRIERQAELLLHEIQPSVLTGKEPFHIERFVDLHLEDLTGVEPDYRHLPPGIYGLTDQNEMVIELSLVEEFGSSNFLHSTMAHEVGHALFHVPVLRKFGRQQVFEQKGKNGGEVYLYRRKDVKAYEDPEWQAWRFASAVLMPRGAITGLLRRGYSKYDLARHFQVNEVFVQTRCRQLNI